MTAIHGIYFIADRGSADWPDLERAVRAALEAGVHWIQYRDKDGGDARRREGAAALLALCREFGARLIVNDDVALAEAVGADGVHLGADDPDIDAARAALGPDAVVGVSCYNRLERGLAAERAGADYAAFGSVYPSPTKPDAPRAPLDLIRLAVRRLTIPVVAIGGITPANAGAVALTGADSVAVISGILAAEDPGTAARRLGNLFRADTAN